MFCNKKLRVCVYVMYGRYHVTSFFNATDTDTKRDKMNYRQNASFFFVLIFDKYFHYHHSFGYLYRKNKKAYKLFIYNQDKKILYNFLWNVYFLCHQNTNLAKNIFLDKYRLSTKSWVHFVFTVSKSRLGEGASRLNDWNTVPQELIIEVSQKSWFKNWHKTKINCASFLAEIFRYA